MSGPLFIQEFSTRLLNRLPFAFYRLPGTSTLEAFLQSDGRLLKPEQETGEGFYLSPFDSEEESYYIARDTHQTYDYLDFSPNDPYGFDPESSITSQAYQELIEKSQKQMQAGGLEKVVLSRQLVGSYPQDQLPYLFHRLLIAYPQAFVYAAYHPEIGFWIGASPEIFVKSVGDAIETMALAGTKSIQKNHQPWGAKEIREQAFVEDHIENQLALIMSQDQIFKGDRKTLDAGPVQHLCTRFQMRSGDNSLSDIVNVLHPTPAVCGFPTALARDFILKEEPNPRSLYTGYIGPKTAESASYFVNLRCASFAQGILRCYVGGGITDQSIPQAEWKETEYKAQTFLKVL